MAAAAGASRRGSSRCGAGRAAGAVPIAEEQLRRFRDYLYRETGLHYPDARLDYVERRLAERIAATGATDFQAYFALLRSGVQGELERVINRFTVNETYFLREDHQLRCLVADLLPAIVARKRPGEPIRLWSLPCATGEEPYSIAIWLLENWAEVDRYDVEITGSDIDTAALKAAEAGCYGTRSVMRLPPALLRRYFAPAPREGEWCIGAPLRSSVSFARVNLVDCAETAAWRGFDVVFCRNLLIYFDDTSRRIAAENLHDCLAPGGFLCLGHSESMSRISPIFAVRRFEEAVVYQKPGGGAP